MSNPKHVPGYVPNPHYTQQDWDEVSDSPELTEADFARARPATEAFPELVESMRKKRGPQKSPTKQLVSIRLDRRVIEHYKAAGDGWQTRINDALLKAAQIEKAD